MTDAHRCCRDRERVTEGEESRWLPALIEAERGLCERCILAVKRAARELDEDYWILSNAVGDRLVTGGEHVSGTHEAPIPINTTVLALRSTLSEWAEVALGIVCPVLNIEPQERQRARGFPIRELVVISQACKVIPESLDTLLGAQAEPVNVWNREGTGWVIEELDGVAVALHLLRTHSQVRNALGDTNPRTRLQMPCPVLDCGSMTLGVDNGETDVNCTSCGGKWSRREYDWLGGMLVEDHKKEKKTLLEWVAAERKWLLEVAEWLLAERGAILARVTGLANLTEEDCTNFAIGAFNVVTLLKEVIAA